MGNIPDLEEEIEDIDDPRSPSEKFLTVMAYRPRTKTWDESVMQDVRELARMREAGEPIPDMGDLPEWRTAIWAERKKRAIV